jgi:predicted transglutaminase-like cysteine proteinase
MSRLLAFVAITIALCAGGPTRADDEFSAARQYSGLMTKWRGIQMRMSEDASRLALCRAAPEACRPEEKQFAAIVEAARAHEGRALIGHINRAVNLAIRPISDLRRFGVVDEWTPPLETLQAGAGDCEDYAILKFHALREAGFAAADLKLVIVRVPSTRTDHAVVAARLSSQWVVLDNRGFALVDLDRVRYRILAQLSAESDNAPASLAGAAVADAPLLM